MAERATSRQAIRIAVGSARIRTRRHRIGQRLGAADPRALRRARLRDGIGRKSAVCRSDFLIMNGNGGMISARFVTRESAKTVMSGPASGVIAAAYTGRRAGFENLVTYDMGGTSTDVALIRNAEPAVSNEIEIEYAMPIHVPMVAVHTVGAGGGSIARVDAAGLIQIGPESAGANPGPICYGRGGTGADHHRRQSGARPARRRRSCWRSKIPSTVGGVSPENLRRQDRQARPASTASRQRVRCCRLGNMKMAGAIRMVSVSRGHDPARFRAVCLRWRRPVACDSALARELGLPKRAGAGAPGHHQRARLRRCRPAPRFRQHASTSRWRCSTSNAASRRIGTRHRNEGEELIGKEAVRSRRRIRVTHSADMQFVGQTHHHQCGAAVVVTSTRATLQQPVRREPISPASRSSCRKSVPTSSISTRR
jgi:N-methylhydantoinase A